jgi:hypothetical protein
VASFSSVQNSGLCRSFAGTQPVLGAPRGTNIFHIYSSVIKLSTGSNWWARLAPVTVSSDDYTTVLLPSNFWRALRQRCTHASDLALVVGYLAFMVPLLSGTAGIPFYSYFGFTERIIGFWKCGNQSCAVQVDGLT